MMRKVPAPVAVDLGDLERNPPPALGPSKAPAHVEAAGLCLESEGHESGVTLELHQEQNSSRVRLRWSLRSGAARSWDNIEATDYGAVAVALSLLRRVLGLEALDRGRIPSGFDYWLGTDDGVLSAVVEISGIRRGTEGQIATRLRQKKQQIQAHHGQLTAYAFVVEFSRPRADMGTR